MASKKTIIKIENNRGTVNIFTGNGIVEIHQDGVKIKPENHDEEYLGFALPENAEELGLVEENPPGPGPGEEY